MDELIPERCRNACVIGERIRFDVHVDHHAARIRKTGGRIDQRHRLRPICGELLNADEQRAQSEPEPQSPKGKGVVPPGSPAWYSILRAELRKTFSILLRLNCRILQEAFTLAQPRKQKAGCG